jgi:hypothetical protein
MRERVDTQSSPLGHKVAEMVADEITGIVRWKILLLPLDDRGDLQVLQRAPVDMTISAQPLQPANAPVSPDVLIRFEDKQLKMTRHREGVRRIR